MSSFWNLAASSMGGVSWSNIILRLLVYCTNLDRSSALIQSLRIEYYSLIVFKKILSSQVCITLILCYYKPVKIKYDDP